MRAAECIALVMEPVSKFYTDPVLVLDFQSFYPSIMIAYNYWFFVINFNPPHLSTAFQVTPHVSGVFLRENRTLLALCLTVLRSTT